MRTKWLKLRFRRHIRKGQKQVEGLSSQAEQQIDRHLFKRFDRLAPVRRFVFSWVGLVVLLIVAVVIQNLSLSGYYQTLTSVPGGIYEEGVRGRFTNANPMYAVSDADATVSRLVFAGLLTYDADGHLIGDLAKNYEVNGSTYTVHLKSGLKWQDGKPLTSQDVAFTFQSIQNPDAQSPLRSSWQGVTITATDSKTVVFKLPGVLASFPYNLTTGIVPKHLLGNVPPADLRSAEFNTVKPVGAGPFAWQAVKVTGDGDPKNTQQQIALQAFNNYQAGQPKIHKFIVHVYASEDQLVKALAGGQLTGAEGLTQVPPELADDRSLIKHYLPLRAAEMVFFKTSGNGVLASQPVRHALIQGTDVNAIIKRLGYPTRAVREPILAGQLGYDPALAQPSYDLAAARVTLASDGWLEGKNGIRYKDGRPLEFTLTAVNTPETRMVTDQLKSQWRQLGMKLNVQLLDAGDFQNALSAHSYEAVMNGISIGSDPDVFVYWDSTQADVRSANRLNFSEYKNNTADSALEAGRTRIDPKLRVIKYRPFLEAWQKDNPALGLYQPSLLYLTRGRVDGLTDRPINAPVDRLDNVQNWQIREARVSN